MMVNGDGTTGKTAYAWFVWDRDYTGPTTVDWL